MINHGWTLLQNVKPVYPVGVYGAQWVDPGFVPRAEPVQVRELKKVLFGVNPDAWTRNYRSTQYLSLVQGNATARGLLDSRATYRFESQSLNQSSGVWVTPVTGSGELTVTGIYSGDDYQGQNMVRLLVGTESADAVLSTGVNLTGNYLQVLLLGSGAPAPASVAMQPLPVPGMSVSVDGMSETALWQLELVDIPRRGLAEIIKLLAEQEHLLSELWVGLKDRTWLEECWSGFGTDKLLSAVMTVILATEGLNG